MGELISVIVPIYQVEAYLDQCIQSILAQTYQNLEIILVVQESGDRCLEICKGYAGRDARIKLIFKEKKIGLYAARQLGLLASTGRYVAFVDSDDWLDPRMYERMYELAVRFDVAVVDTGYFYHTAHDSFKTRVSAFEEGCYKGERFDCMIAPNMTFTRNRMDPGVHWNVWSKLYKREEVFSFQAADVPTQKIFDDIVMVVPLLLKTKSLCITHECFYHYRYRADSIMHSVQRNILAVEYYKSTFQIMGERVRDVAQREVKLGLERVLFYRILEWLECIDDPDSDVFLSPYGGIARKDRLILYGAGWQQKIIKDYIERAAGTAVIAWLDQKYETFDPSMGVQAPERARQYDYDWIVLAAKRPQTIQSMKDDLLALEVPESKIRTVLPEYYEDPWPPLKKARLNGERIVEGAFENWVES